MVDATLKAKVEAKVAQCIQVIETTYNVQFKKPAITFDVRGTTGGKAYTTKWIVAFNSVLLSENGDAFIQSTVPHEVAHLATELIYPHAHRRGFGQKRSPHGREWASIMRALGADANRCHTFDTTNARVKKTTSFAYKCPNCGQGFSLGPKRHKKQQNGGTYYHPACGAGIGRLVLASAPATPAPMIKPVVAVPTVSKPSVPQGETKMAKCYRLFENYPGYSRAEMINVFVQECDCTPAGASSYYSTIKKMVG